MDANARTLYIENFPLDTTEKILRQLFVNFGRVKKLDLPLFPNDHPLNRGSPKPKSQGYAFIEYFTVAETEKAYTFFNDLDVILSTSNDVGDTSLQVTKKQELDEFTRKIVENQEFRKLLLLRVMQKKKYLDLSHRYEEQRFQSLVRVAKLLLISDTAG